MKELRYTVRFNTPAFLGNAEQAGQWRTPPFKALLRQWWRVAYAAERNFDVSMAEMRREEGLLFGNAWLSHRENGREVADHRKSLVRLRLDRWDEGKLKTWQALATVRHPEVSVPVGSDLYLGYGPITLQQRNTRLPQGRVAIQAGESALLSVAVPTSHKDPELNRLLQTNVPRIEHALWLMDSYGTLGGRSRNGWGSFSLLPNDETSRKAFEQRSIPLRPLPQCLTFDWPHAIGSDGAGMLAWQTKPFDDWKALMRELAIIKIGLRTQFVFPNVRPPHTTVEPRHWLSYPITTHVTNVWNRNARLPNSLRYKVRPDVQNPGKLRGVVFHVPCLPPPEFDPNRNAIIAVWQQVHALLDELGKPSSERSYAMIADENRRSQLKSQLNSVSLTRIQE